MNLMHCFYDGILAGFGVLGIVVRCDYESKQSWN